MGIYGIFLIMGIINRSFDHCGFWQERLLHPSTKPYCPKPRNAQIPHLDPAPKTLDPKPLNPST